MALTLADRRPLISLRRDWAVPALVAISLAALVIATALMLHANPLHADSPSYLTFDESRPVGYPAFLWLVEWVSGDVGWAIPLQIAILTSALLYLGIAILRVTGAKTAIGAQIALVAFPQMWSLSSAVLSEALATSLVAIWCALLIRATRDRTRSALVELTIVAALAMTIRPSLIVLFGGTVAYAITAVEPRRWLPFLSAIIAALTVAWGLTPASQFLVHGSTEASSPLARGVLQHTLFCPMTVASSDPDARAVQSAAAPVQTYVSSAPSEIRSILRGHYSSVLRFGVIIPKIGRAHGLSWGWQTDRYISAIAAERVASNPLCYAGSALGAYWRMATFDTSKSRAQIDQAARYVADHPQPNILSMAPLPGDLAELKIASDELGQTAVGKPRHPRLELRPSSPDAVIVASRIVGTGAAAIGLFGIGAALIAWVRRRSVSPGILILAILGIVYHGVIVVTALVELGLTRYLVPLWPVVCASWAVAIHLAWQHPAVDIIRRGRKFTRRPLPE